MSRLIVRQIPAIMIPCSTRTTIIHHCSKKVKINKICVVREKQLLSQRRCCVYNNKGYQAYYILLGIKKNHSLLCWALRFASRFLSASPILNRIVSKSLFLLSPFDTFKYLRTNRITLSIESWLVFRSCNLIISCSFTFKRNAWSGSRVSFLVTASASAENLAVSSATASTYNIQWILPMVQSP